jgi:ABC-2 type transport system permease protein
MIRLITIELHKLRSAPAAWVSLAVAIALGGLSVASNALVPNPSGPAFGSTDHVNHALSVAALTSMVMLAIGIIMMAGEYRHRTIVSTY